MTAGPGSTERHYHRLLDKLKTRSHQIFVKAQMQNRAQEQRLRKVVNTLEKDRDISILKAHEGIWKVSLRECPMPRLAKPEGQPSYLARPKATTLPTPAELATLMPKTRANRQLYASHAQSIVTNATKPPPKQYKKISNRRLSTMTSDQVQIWHYRKALNDLATDEKGEELNAANSPEIKTETHTLGGGGTSSDEKWASPVEKTKIMINETSKTSVDESTAVAEESVRMVMRKLGIRPRSSSLSYSQRTRLKKKRPHTSAGTCSTIAERKIDPRPNNKVLGTNYLDMYTTQMKSHVRRIASKEGAMPAPSIRIDDFAPQHRDKRPISSLDNTTPSRVSVPSKVSYSPCKLSSPTFTLESRGITNPAKKERPSTLMQQTASSSSRSSPGRQTRRVSTQIMHASAFETLHDEAQKMQSCKMFRRESLQVDDNANSEDVVEGELLDEMKSCRYIRWGKQNEAIVEANNENEALLNQLALLTLKYTPHVNY